MVDFRNVKIENLVEIYACVERAMFAQPARANTIVGFSMMANANLQCVISLVIIRITL